MSARAAIFGCAGPTLSAQEQAFFHEADPWGFILFARNVETPDQLRALTDALRDCVGRRAPILMDQEGGRWQTLRPPHWRAAPAAAQFGALYARDRDAALAATRINHTLIARDLRSCGVDVCCAPVLDLPVDGADPIIGDRAFSSTPEVVAALGRAALLGLNEGGVTGVVKHIPGHGRALVDSHTAAPTVTASRLALQAHDFTPFYVLADAAVAMTAHIIYAAYDAQLPATVSRVTVREAIRGDIGFDGLLITDDIAMGALSGPMGVRTAEAVAAGCDIVLHCNGDMAEMQAVAAYTPVLAGEALRRADAAAAPEALAARADDGDAAQELERLLADAGSPA